MHVQQVPGPLFSSFLAWVRGYLVGYCNTSGHLMKYSINTTANWFLSWTSEAAGRQLLPCGMDCWLMGFNGGRLILPGPLLEAQTRQLLQYYLISACIRFHQYLIHSHNNNNTSLTMFLTLWITFSCVDLISTHTPSINMIILNVIIVSTIGAKSSPIILLYHC